MIYHATAGVVDMDPRKAFAALNSDIRLEILRILAQKPRSTIETLDELRKNGFDIKYRASIYRGLEKLVSTGFAEKYYDKNERGIRYRLLKTKIEIDFETGSVK